MNQIASELLRRKASEDYLSFVKYSNPEFTETTFHRFLCKRIQDFIDYQPTNALAILLIATPPRVGKTLTLTSTLPAYLLGKMPDKQVILASYQTALAEQYSRSARDKFIEYSTKVFNASSSDQMNSINWGTDKKGMCHAAGLQAGITGYGADIFILDDPIKNQQEADSDTVITRIHSEMGPSVQSRIYPGGKLIIIGTPWVENDVHNYARTNWSEFIWDDIVIPCECEDEATDRLGRRVGEFIIGNHLNDGVYPNEPISPRIDYTGVLGLTKKKLVIASDGERTWNALYQCRPAASKGNLFIRENFKIMAFDPIPRAFDYTCMSVDASFKDKDTSDPVAIGIWGIKGGEPHLLDIINKRMNFVKTYQIMKDLVIEYPDMNEIVIEDKANGTAIADLLVYNDLASTLPPITRVNPLGGKYARAQSISPWILDHPILIRTDISNRHYESDVKGDNAIDGYIRQMMTFPFAKHDDMVDMTSQAVARLYKLATGEDPMPEQKYYKFVKWYPDMWDDYNNMNARLQDEFIRRYGAPLEWRDIV